MTITAVEWLDWVDVDGCVVSRIRKSSCGQYIEKQFCTRHDAEAAFESQFSAYIREDGVGVPDCFPSNNPFTYISECAETPPDWWVEELMTQYRIWNGADMVDDNGDYTHKAKLYLDNAEFTQIELWDKWSPLFIEATNDLSHLNSDDHLANWGILRGELVCIDFDSYHNNHGDFTMNLNEDFIFQINWFMDKPYEEAQEIAANMISSRYDVADKKPQAYNSAVFWGTRTKDDEMEKFTALIPLMCAALYSVQAGIHLYQGEKGWALMWASYALANIGIIVAHANGK